MSPKLMGQVGISSEVEIIGIITSGKHAFPLTIAILTKDVIDYGIVTGITAKIIVSIAKVIQNG